MAGRGECRGARWYDGGRRGSIRVRVRVRVRV